MYLRSEYLNTCIFHLKDILSKGKTLIEIEQANGVLRCLNLIRSLLDESEKHGIGNLKSHTGLVKGELLSFSVANEITSGSDVPKKVDLKLYSNTTVYELRLEISKQIKVTWDQIKLLRSNAQKEIKDNENGKTIGDIRIRNGESITASRRPTPSIPQTPLVNSEGVLHPLARKVFIDWFERFSENGKMAPDHCAAFINSCTSI